MKKVVLLTALTLLFCNLFIQIAHTTPLTQDNTDVAALKKTNASLRGELAKERTTLSKQIQRNDTSIARLKATISTQQAAINDLQTAVNNAQTNASVEWTSLNGVGQSLHKRKMFGITGVIALLIGLIYMLSLRRKVSAANEHLARMEANLNQEITKANQEIIKANNQMKDYISKETADMKAMVERQTTENKNRIIALLADTNQIVHNMSDQVNKNIETKIAALKNEVTVSTNAISERLNNLHSNKTS